MTYRRCQCRTGDHDLDGTPDHCLNRVPLSRRLCDDCRGRQPKRTRKVDPVPTP